MKLVTEQAEMLNGDLERYDAERQRLLNQKKNKSSDGQSQGEIGQLTPLDIIQRIADISKKMQEINLLLETSEIVGNPNTDQVQIGSKFTVGIYFGEEDIDIIESTLIEKKVSAEKTPDFITAESDLGVAISGKKMGEMFYYPLKNGNMAQGTVMDIQKEPKAKESQVVKNK